MLLGFLSDAHGNIDGFRKGLKLLSKRGAGEIFFLGDAIGYLPGTDVVKELQHTDLSCVMGNHEAMLLAENVDLEKDKVYQLSVIRKLLDLKEIDYLQTWPASITLQYDQRKILLVHGSPADPTFGYVYPDTDLEQFCSIEHDVILMANTHHPFVRYINNKLFINVGSCGLPRDEKGTGSVCLYNSTSNMAEIVRYDISDSAEKLVHGHLNIHPAVIRHLERSIEVAKR